MISMFESKVILHCTKQASITVGLPHEHAYCWQGRDNRLSGTSANLPSPIIGYVWKHIGDRPNIRARTKGERVFS